MRPVQVCRGPRALESWKDPDERTIWGEKKRASAPRAVDPDVVAVVRVDPRGRGLGKVWKAEGLPLVHLSSTNQPIAEKQKRVSFPHVR